MHIFCIEKSHVAIGQFLKAHIVTFIVVLANTPYSKAIVVTVYISKSSLQITAQNGISCIIPKWIPNCLWQRKVSVAMQSNSFAFPSTGRQSSCYNLVLYWITTKRLTLNGCSKTFTMAMHHIKSRNTNFAVKLWFTFEIRHACAQYLAESPVKFGMTTKRWIPNCPKFVRFGELVNLLQVQKFDSL